MSLKSVSKIRSNDGLNESLGAPFQLEAKTDCPVHHPGELVT